MIEKDIWENCYEVGWGKLIVSDAFCHPAKFSYNLIEKIYTHTIDNSWLKKGDLVLDPFGGVALGALGAIKRGINWVGVELEEKFVDLGCQNIELWKSSIIAFPSIKHGTARIIHGDSRKLKFCMARLIGTPDLVVSSPPYAESEICSSKQADREQRKIDRKNKTWEGYNKQNKANLGSTSGDTFWSASKEIVQECYDLLKPGGHAIWVTKDYVRDKKRVKFSDRWTSLCESVGFKVVCSHYATVVKTSLMGTLDGSKITTERKSFFRRLQESKGAPKIDWEDVTCMVK